MNAWVIPAVESSVLWSLPRHCSYIAWLVADVFQVGEIGWLAEVSVTEKINGSWIPIKTWDIHTCASSKHQASWWGMWGGGGQGYSKEAFILYVWGHNQGKYVIVVSRSHTPIAQEKEAVCYAALFSATNHSSEFSRRSQGVKQLWNHEQLLCRVFWRQWSNSVQPALQQMLPDPFPLLQNGV